MEVLMSYPTHIRGQVSDKKLGLEHQDGLAGRIATSYTRRQMTEMFNNRSAFVPGLAVKYGALQEDIEMALSYLELARLA